MPEPYICFKKLPSVLLKKELKKQVQ